ncbi:MAG: PKD domain-containing protein [Cytophagales bacterium]|nr:MAG: PKD domain-containing protein [Cytophagales bacterium]
MKQLLALLFLAAFLIHCHQEIPTPPQSAFSIQGGNCNAPCEVTFTSTSQADQSYTWDFGDGKTGTGSTVKHIYSSPKTYAVKLIVNGEGGSSGSTQSVTILPPPIASFSIQSNSCTAPCTLTFTNSSQHATTFQWDFGNGGSSTQTTPTQQYTTAGSYTVKLIASGNGMSVNTQQTVTIYAPRLYLDLPFATMVMIKGGTCKLSGGAVYDWTVKDFYMAQYEVTQRQWQAVMGTNPSFFKGCDDCPVEQVSRKAVQEFLVKINQQRPAGTPKFRLPTEQEWEYAAGGGAIGNRTRFGNGKNIATPVEINYNGSISASYSELGINRKKTVTVGSFAPNGLGLYDMSGNVEEWTDSFYYSTPLAYLATLQLSYFPSIDGSTVVRGGGWKDGPEYCGVPSRTYHFDPWNDLGFRLVASVD